MASTQCPNCKSKFRIPEEKAAQVSGKSVKCAKCGDRFVIVLDTNTPKSVAVQPKSQLRQTPEQSPNLKEESSLYAEEGSSLIRQCQYTFAENILKKAIELDSSNVAAYVNMGMLFYNQNLYGEAIPWFEKALQIDSNIPDVSDALEISKELMVLNENPQNVMIHRLSCNSDVYEAVDALEELRKRSSKIQNSSLALVPMEKRKEVPVDVTDATRTRHCYTCNKNLGYSDGKVVTTEILFKATNNGYLPEVAASSKFYARIDAGSSTNRLLCLECHTKVICYAYGNKEKPLAKGLDDLAVDLVIAMAINQCFIATAIYDSPESHQVKTLRKFRDEILLSYKLGKAFVSWYYRTSPPIAKFLTNHRFIKKFIRFVLLDPIVFIINQFNFLRIRN